MAIAPVVRYMILCDDWRPDPDNPRRVIIFGLLSNVHSLDEPAYPLLYREMCVFLAVTDGYGSGAGKIVCVSEEDGRTIFETRSRPIGFGPDPLEIVGVPFRIRDCLFPAPGLYSIQFWYDGELVEERPLRMR